MKQSMWKVIFLVDVFLGMCLLKADGFAAGTLVHTQKGYIPIEQCEVGNNVLTRDCDDAKAYPIADKIQFVVNSYTKIQMREDCLYVAPDQKFYAINKNKWLEACSLQPSDELLCANGKSVCVEAIAVIYEQQRAFKVIKKIEKCDGFNKGDYVAIDALHKDHLEVFDKRGRWVRVADFDGSKNDDKTRQGEKESRGGLE